MGKRSKFVWVCSAVFWSYPCYYWDAVPKLKRKALLQRPNRLLSGALSTGFLYGWDAEKAMKLAGEINAEVDVGGEKRPLKVEVRTPVIWNRGCR